MSGLLRRIKRSRAADAGEPPSEGQAAVAEGAPAAETPAGEAATQVLPEARPPAGLEPGEVVAPVGRRGRLRRRLRYLRRVRELMLRDLGGLFFEVHRSGRGDVGAHARVIDAKVQRIVRVDAEAAAIEEALGAPRSETVVFEPGIGGTCEACGELYGSDARFCSHCGTPTGAVAAAPAPAPAPAADAPGEPRPVPPMPKAPRKPRTRKKPAEQPKPAAEEPKPGADEQPTIAEQPKPAAEEPKPGADEQPTIAEQPKPAPADDPKPAGGNRTNGRTEDRPPKLSSGDPLAGRETRS